MVGRKERSLARPLLEGVNWERIQTRPCAMPLIDIVCLQFEGGFLEAKAGHRVHKGSKTRGKGWVKKRGRNTCGVLTNWGMRRAKGGKY